MIGEFTGRRTWGAVPVKSAISSSPWIVTVSAMVWGSGTPAISMASDFPYVPSGSRPMPARMPASVRRKISSATGRSVGRPNSRASRSRPRAPIQPAAI